MEQFHDRVLSQRLKPMAHDDSGDDGNPAPRWTVFLGPVICFGMFLVGVTLDSITGATSPHDEAWPPGRVATLTAFLIAFVAGGSHISGHAFDDLRRGRVSIDLLMILAAIGAAAIGDWADGALLLFLFSLSHALEHYILGRTRQAIRSLMQLTPDEALVLRDGQELRVSVESLRIGDTVIVTPASRIPADGTIVTGTTSVDQSPLTGESVPVDKQPGDLVYAGTLNQQGLVRVSVTQASSRTMLSRMVELVEKAQSERATSQRFTDWFGERYTWLVLIVSLAVLWIGTLTQDEPFKDSFYRAMTVLVVAAPCAVVISIPAAILAAITSAARGGVLVKGGIPLELAATLKAMAFDKTGTLTTGKPLLVDVIPTEGVTEDELLTAAAALEKNSEHPLAHAIVEAARERKLPVREAADVQSVTGHGIAGTILGRRMQAGKLAWFVNSTIAISPDLRQQAEILQQSGKTVICVSNETHVWGLLAVADTLRPTARVALQKLREQGLSPLIMLSGDHPTVVAQIAGELGIEARGELLPEDKLRLIETLRQEHGPVGMIGDGMNDAPSLAAADVGVSLAGTGTDVALEMADIVLLGGDLRRLPYVIDLARQTQRVIRQNLVAAFTVMGVMLIMATFFSVPLPLAVVAHEGSTVAVILNGLRLLAFPRVRS